MNTAEQDTERMFFWIKVLGTDYAKASGPKKKQMKRDYAVTKNTTPGYITDYSLDETVKVMRMETQQLANAIVVNYPFANCKTVPLPKCGQPKDTPMTYTPEMEQRSYLQNRLWGIEHNKMSELRKQFHMDPDPKPTTGSDLVARIIAGKYMIEDTTDVFGEKTNRIVWRDPASPADKASYEAALAAMRKAQEDVKDTITVMPPVDGLAALRAFESTTIH